MAIRLSRTVSLGVTVCACLCACGGSANHPASVAASRATTAATASTTTATPVAAVKPHPRHRHPAPALGSLPQTMQLPSSDARSFHAGMAALWTAIRTGSVRPGMPAFFPEGAYAQVKAIADPSADYTDRLVADYRLDIEAAHALLGTHAARTAHLMAVQVPGAYAHWVDPGVCANRVGYYEVPNSRVVYRESGAVRSFGIASMISWRGVWYVVHLGAVLRGTGGGVVDDPSPGAGVSLASSTC